MFPRITPKNLEKREEKTPTICPYYEKHENQCEFIAGLTKIIVEGCSFREGSERAEKAKEAQRNLRQTIKSFCGYSNYKQCPTFLINQE